MSAIANKDTQLHNYAMTCTQQTLSKTITKARHHILATTAMLCTQQPLSKTITKATHLGYNTNHFPNHKQKAKLFQNKVICLM